MKKKINKSSKSGLIVSNKEAQLNPNETYSQTVEMGYKHEHCDSCKSEIGFNEAKTYIPEKDATLCDECAKDYQSNEAEPIQY